MILSEAQKIVAEMDGGIFTQDDDGNIDLSTGWVTLDDSFTVDDLEAIVIVMRSLSKEAHSAVGQAVPGADMKIGTEYPYVSGTVWQSSSFHRCVLTYCGEEGFCLMGVSRHAHGFPAMVMHPFHDRGGRWLYRDEELPERLADWACLGYWNGENT